MSAAFTTDKANQEFELKFTLPAGLLLNVIAPIANKNAVYHQLGTNLVVARRALEQLQGEDAHTVETGAPLADDVWTAAISTMTELWKEHKPQEVAPGGTAQNPASKDLRKEWNTKVKKAYETAYSEYHRAAAADRAALAAMNGPPGLPPPPLKVSIATPQRAPEPGEPDAIDVLLGRMGNHMTEGHNPEVCQDGLLRRTGNGQGAVEICELRPCPLLWCRSATALSRSACPRCARSGRGSSSRT